MKEEDSGWMRKAVERRKHRMAGKRPRVAELGRRKAGRARRKTGKKAGPVEKSDQVMTDERRTTHLLGK